MSSSPTLFFDVGGVLLTNAWDTAARERVAASFGLDPVDFHTRHGMLKTSFETGRLSLDAYIEKTALCSHRDFTRAQFREAMLAQSRVLEGGALDWVRSLAATGRYRLFTLNNESRELQEYRVRTFGLCPIFGAFLTSCYLGRAKPDEEIYRDALGIADCGVHDAIFIDDRPVNVETALTLGLRAIRFAGLDSLRAALADLGVHS